MKACLEDRGEQVTLLYDIAAQYGNADMVAEAMPFMTRAFEVARNAGDTFAIVKSGRGLSQLWLRISRSREADRILQCILPIAQRHAYTVELGLIYNNLGLCKAMLCDYDEALMYHFKSLELRGEQHNKAQTSISYHNIGFVYYKLEDFDLALEYFAKALALKEELNDMYDRSALLLNISLCYAATGNYERADEFIDRALNACYPSCSRSVEMQGHFVHGIVAFSTGELNAAKAYFSKANNLSLLEGDKRFAADSKLYLARIEERRQNYATSISIFEESERISLAEGYNRILMEAYKGMANANKALGRYKRASRFQDEYERWRDTVASQQLSNKIMRVRADYEDYKHGMALSHSKEIITRQKTEKALMATLIFLLVGLTISLYKLIKMKQGINCRLNEKVLERTKELNAKETRLKRLVLRQQMFLTRLLSQIRAQLASVSAIGHYAQLVEEPFSSTHVTSGLVLNDTKKLEEIIDDIQRFNAEKIQSSGLELSVMVAELLQRISLEIPDMSVRTEISPNVTISQDCPIISVIESILKHVMLVCESKNVFVQAFQTLGLLNVRLTFFGLAMSTDNHDLYEYVRKLPALNYSVAIDERSSTTSILVQAVPEMDDQI